MSDPTRVACDSKQRSHDRCHGESLRYGARRDSGHDYSSSHSAAASVSRISHSNRVDVASRASVSERRSRAALCVRWSWLLTLSLYLFLISVLLGPAHRQLKGMHRKKMRQDGTISPSPRMRTLRPYWMQGQKKEHKHTPQLPKQPNRPSGDTAAQTSGVRVRRGVGASSDSWPPSATPTAAACVVRSYGSTPDHSERWTWRGGERERGEKRTSVQATPEGTVGQALVLIDQ